MRSEKPVTNPNEYGWSCDWEMRALVRVKGQGAKKQEDAFCAIEQMTQRDEFERCWPWLEASLNEFGATHTKDQVWEAI